MSEMRRYTGAGADCRSCGLPRAAHLGPCERCPITGLATPLCAYEAGAEWARSLFRRVRLASPYGRFVRLRPQDGTAQAVANGTLGLMATQPESPDGLHRVSWPDGTFAMLPPTWLELLD